MAKKNDIVNFLDDYLNSCDIPDKSANGLQVDGKDEVKQISFAVDACLETFENSTDSDMIIVHHGLFWDKIGPITKDLYGRIKSLMDNEISLLCYHAPLDVHPVVGNNAQIMKIFNIANKKPFGFEHGINWGFMGKLPSTLTLPSLSKRVQETIGNHNVLNFGKKKISTLAVVSGGASFVIPEAAQKCDAVIIGEMTHNWYHAAKELKINVIEAGHYQTEVFGVKALMSVLSKKFKVKTNFLDIPTGY